MRRNYAMANITAATQYAHHRVRHGVVTTRTSVMPSTVAIVRHHAKRELFNGEDIRRLRPHNGRVIIYAFGYSRRHMFSSPRMLITLLQLLRHQATHNMMLKSVTHNSDGGMPREKARGVTDTAKHYARHQYNGVMLNAAAAGIMMTDPKSEVTCCCHNTRRRICYDGQAALLLTAMPKRRRIIRAARRY